jgi:uncharacterized peroxidase-related enzyme
MAFIRTIPVAEATGDVKTVYEDEKEPSGDVANYVKVFAHRPEVWKKYQEFAGSIRRNFDLRRYELVTVAAAAAIESSYCTLAHGQILSEKVLGPEQTQVFIRDFRQADLTPAEKAMVGFVRKFAVRTSSITQEDVDELHKHGFSDTEIFDIAAATMMRCFFSKLLEGLGAEPDHFYSKLDPALRQALTVGKPIESPPK